MKTETLDTLQEISFMLDRMGYGEGLRLGHITHDTVTNNNYDYRIIRESTHDGTHLFINELISETLFPLVAKQSVKNGVDVSEIKDIEYIVGDLILDTDYDDEKYPKKQANTTYLPVKCRYIFE